MAINKKLIHFKSKQKFDEELAKGNILEPSIVFIQDSKEISTHGTIYKSVNWSVLENPLKNIPNGVYAVSADGRLIEVANADSSCVAVAFISNNQKVMIAKEDAAYGTNTTLYWGYNLKGQDVPNLANFANNTAAMADYNGKANTADIIAGYATLGKDMDSQDMCKVLETYNEGGYTDWYIPAAGQLYEFYSNKAALNEALAAISGTEFASDFYWSSSELPAGSAWCVDFSTDDVCGSDKYASYYVRFVRDLQ